VVHRDVSPSNILISRAGEVKIADFGIALAAGDRRAGDADRRRIMGKWRYMSPEQARGETVEIQSDIFSAAAVWFELFTGDKLFPGDDAEDIIRNIATMPIPKASARRDGLPPRLDELLRQALEREPGRRPEASTLLRGLVEVSYGSSIVASALDVKAAVSEALAADPHTASGTTTAAGPAGLDDLIRQQLGSNPTAAEEEDARRTAVAPLAPELDAFAVTAPAGNDLPIDTGTFVKLGVDANGVARWEADHETIAAAPRALRGRTTAPPPVDLPDSRSRRRPILVAAIAAALVGGGFVAWRLAGGGEEKAASAGPFDAAPVVSTTGKAILVIDSDPPGAAVRVDERLLPQPTRTSIEIAPGATHRVSVELEGYQPWQDEVTAGAGERVRIVAPLVARRATLRVTTRPPGATVELDGVEIGQTPLARGDLRAGAGRTLVLRKADFKPVSMTIDLSHTAPFEIDRRLESSVSYGRITINIRDSWADVTLGGKPVGRTTDGSLRLPLGRQRLRLSNPVSRKSKNVTVDVAADKINHYDHDL
jgi:hypothetical protein